MKPPIAYVETVSSKITSPSVDLVFTLPAETAPETLISPVAVRLTAPAETAARLIAEPDPGVALLAMVRLPRGVSAPRVPVAVTVPVPESMARFLPRPKSIGSPRVTLPEVLLIVTLLARLVPKPPLALSSAVSYTHLTLPTKA